MPRIARIVAAAGLPLRAPALGVARYVELMRMDKKAEAGHVRFIVLQGPGRAAVQGADAAGKSSRQRSRRSAAEGGPPRVCEIVRQGCEGATVRLAAPPVRRLGAPAASGGFLHFRRLQEDCNATLTWIHPDRADDHRRDHRDPGRDRDSVVLGVRSPRPHHRGRFHPPGEDGEDGAVLPGQPELRECVRQRRAPPWLQSRTTRPTSHYTCTITAGPPRRPTPSPRRARAASPASRTRSTRTTAARRS